ncbi:MAG: AAA family ATPase [Actinobacteria bacterium]|nr:AAA family ATPase [Actinomycetota bacterium]
MTKYLPRLAIEWAENSPDQRWREIDGSLVFVDISGFTALSERLAKKGQQGAEELTETLSHCFAELLAVSYAAGGSLMKFGGDALLLLYTGDGHAERACTSALHMRSTMETVGRVATTVGNVRLRMSVGVNRGPLHFFRVGDSHKELILTGPGVSGTVLMEGIAEAGEIVASPDTVAEIPSRLVGPPKDAGLLLRNRRAELPLGPTTAVAPPTIDLSETIPTALREELLAGTAESQHRHATVAFIHFDGVDSMIANEGADATAAALDELVSDVQRAVDEQGVTFLGTDVDRDGGKIILVAGAPRAMGDDEGRMLRALRRIADKPRRLPIRIGVNRGHVFVGEVGPPYRRTFTVMGDAVNLAARLMAKASTGQILATAAVLDHSSTAFEAEAVAPFHVKGKADPVEAFLVGAQGKRRTIDDNELLPLTGRDHELNEMLEAWETARGGRGGVIKLTGPSGIGKSRLITELRHRIGDTKVVVAFCESFESGTPYFAFRFLLRGLLGLKGHRGTDGADALRALMTEAAPTLLPWLPLIAEVLDFHVEETEESAAIELPFRPERTRHAVVELMRAVVTQPTVLVVEDAQWLDALSVDLVHAVALAAREQPWLMCLAITDQEELPAVDDEIVTVALAVKPIDDASAVALVNAAGTTTETPLLPHERDALVRQAGGNPLFLERLIRRGARADHSLHDSLEALVTSDIDRLPPADRRLLRYASVLGATFEGTVLAEVVSDDESVPPAAVARRLRSFVEPDGSGLLRFRNQVYREVAYTTLPFRKRRELHARAAAVIEGLGPEVAAERAGVLSVHFLHAQQYERCWRYSHMAAQQAGAKYANVEAAELFERALSAGAQLSDLPRSSVAETWECLGDVLLEAGDFARARNAYLRARRLRAGEPVALAQLCRRLAMAVNAQGMAANAALWLRRGLSTLVGYETNDAVACRAILRMQCAQARQQAGKPRDAVRWAELAIDDATASGNREALADAYAVLDWAMIDLGQTDLATHAPLGLAIWEELDKPGRLAHLTTFLGAFAYWQGKWDEALAYFDRGKAGYKRAGDEINAARCACNAAEVLILQGRYDDARPGLEHAIELWRSVNLIEGLTDAMLNLGRIAVAGDDLIGAVALFEEARSMSVGTNEIMTADADAWLADCFLRQHRNQDALVKIDTALQHELATGGTAHLPMLHRLRGYALVALGKVAESWAEFDKSLTVGRARGASYEVALTLEAISAVAARMGMPTDPTADEERTALLAQLGVRATPPPPLRDDRGVAATH